MAVYTEVSDEALQEYFRQFDLGALTACKGIAAGVENTNYFIHLEQGNFILTLYEKRVKPADLPFFLNLTRHLFSQGINCPQPAADRDGNFLKELSGRPAALFSFLDGVCVRTPQVEHCSELGVALAALHRAGKNFQQTRPNDQSLSQWPELYARIEGKANSLQPGLARLVEDELKFLRQNWPIDLPIGIIHADLFPDNVFFLGNSLSGMIDFYFACNDFLAYDLAICLNSWCFERDFALNYTKAGTLLKNYHRHRPLGALEIEYFPILARGAALRFLLTRLFDWFNVPVGALVRPKDPLEYAAKLRFHQQMRHIGDYGWQS